MVVLFLTDRLEQKTETLQPHDDHTSDKNRVSVSLPTEVDGKLNMIAVFLALWLFKSSCKNTCFAMGLV